MTIAQRIHVLFDGAKAGAEIHTSDILDHFGENGPSHASIRTQLRRMLDRGELGQDRVGYYRLPTEAERAAAAIEDRVSYIVRETSADYAYPFHEGGVGGGQAAVQYEDPENRLFVFAPREVVAGWTGGRVPSPQEAYWTKVRGTSMEPWLPDGSPIFVAVCDRVLDGGRYVIYLDDEDAEVVKRIERIGGGVLRLIADNPAHTSRTLRHIEDEMYEDQEFGVKVRVRVRGVVLYPSDTAHATVRLIARHARSDG